MLVAALGVTAADVGVSTYDVVVVGGTPGGLTAAIAAARGGCSVVVLERTAHVGGLPANGLGATDIGTRGATGGLFAEFVQRNLAEYTARYGADSPQVRDCSDGYHFEPAVGEKTFLAMLAEQPRIQVRLARQFDADPTNTVKEAQRLVRIQVLNRQTQAVEVYQGQVFIDATYEGDLAAAAGVPFRVGREAQTEFQEPMAGVVYKPWGAPAGPGTSGLGDNAVQAFNYRLPLTANPTNRVPITKPANYNRAEFASLVEDLRLNRVAAPSGIKRAEIAWDGIGRLVNMVRLPNGKTDANNQHAAFLSTDLPEENWPWPTSTWEWRDRFANRLREYTLGLLWFAQNDPGLPTSFRERCQSYGLARDEYTDNDHFPRQVYVREGRRVMGEHNFTAHDALPVKLGARPPVYSNSITASHYSLDSHAVRKRESGRVHLEGFFSYPTKPYTVPFGVMVPRQVEGLLTPVPVSGTHIGFSTLRMEPCWMAMGQAAGVAASLSRQRQIPVRQVDLLAMQRELLRQKAVLVYFEDARPGQVHFEALQLLALRGVVTEWRAELVRPVDAGTAARWLQAAGVAGRVEYAAGQTTRGDLLDRIARVLGLL
jgi:hypothetical protein